MTQNNHQHPRRRVVVTGLGAVTPLGNNVETTWQRLTAGDCAIAPIRKFDPTGYPSTIAAEVTDFDPLAYLAKRDARRMAAVLHFAIAAGHQAIEAAKLDLSSADPTRIGVEVGSGIGGADVLEEQRVTIEQHGPRKVLPTTIPAMLISMPACFLSIHFGLQGPVNTPVSACATGISGIGEGMRRIVWGDADVMLAGGTESCITPTIMAGFGRMTALSTRNKTPQRALTPFDASRDGTVIGEGAGVLVLESLDHARARQAPILAEIIGYGFSSDAYHISSPREDGAGAIRAMSNALREANLAPDAVDYIAAHGTGTQMNDAMETQAIKQVLAEAAYSTPISSIKSMTGHTLGAAGAIGAVATIKAMQTSCLPPTIGLETPDPNCDLDYVPNEARPAAISVAMVNGFGFGGQNACLVLRKWSITDDTNQPS